VAALQARSFLVDGEVVVADAQGVASFDFLRGRAREAHAFVWAFDLLELDGVDLHDLPLERRKGELEILLKRASFGLALNDYVAGDGSALFGQERRSSRYRSSRSRHWLEAKNPESPAARLARGLEPEKAMSDEPAGSV
jgi:ATP-dependent DNA ligase